jgi:hypothetical protein
MMDWPVLETLLCRLQAACDECDVGRIRALLTSAPLGFAAATEISDYIWNHRDADFAPAQASNQMSAAE